jgi:hypothetical protein
LTENLYTEAEHKEIIRHAVLAISSQKFEEVLILSSPGGKHICELKEAVSMPVLTCGMS